MDKLPGADHAAQHGPGGGHGFQTPAQHAAHGQALERQTGFFRQFPIDFEEAATIDGAGYFKSFFLVVLPQLKAITGTAILLNALYIWNDTFDQMVFLSGAAAKTLPVEIYALTTAMTAQWNLVFAAVIISLVPMLILYLLTQKKMMTSLAGGIKG